MEKRSTVYTFISLVVTRATEKVILGTVITAYLYGLAQITGGPIG